MSRGPGRPPGSSTNNKRDPDLIPIFIDDPHRGTIYAKPFLWPVDGHARKAAEQLCKPQPGTKDSHVQSHNTASHNLAAYSDAFRDTYLRVPESRMISLQYVVQVQESPPIIFADIIKWDLNTPDILIGSYASRAARDVGLGHRAAILIEEEVKKLINRARQKMETGTEQFVERPADGSKIVSKPSKFPQLIKGDHAKHLLEKHAAKKRTSLGLSSPADAKH